MTFPNYPLPTNRTNATPTPNVHPQDHNRANGACNDLQAQVDAAVAAAAAATAAAVARITALEKNPTCQLYNVSHSITEGLPNQALTWPTEQLDPLNWHAGGTPTRITPNVAGWYETRFGAQLVTAAAVVATVAVWPRLNGVTDFFTNMDFRNYTTGGSSQNPALTAGGPLIHLDGTTDYLEMRFFMDSTDAVTRAWECGWTLSLAYRD